MPRKSRKNVGLIGLGIIGTRVAQGLRAGGFHVFVWNRTPKPAPNFLGSPGEVAEMCDIIQLFVADSQALFSIVDSLAGALTGNHVIICSGTVGPEATLEAARMVQNTGARFLDAPFTGSKLAAEKRQLVYYVGGDDAAFKKVEPMLKAVSKSILRCGEVGHAAVLKVATNMITAVTTQTLAEALALVIKAGLAPATFAAALENNACRSGAMDIKLPKMVAADYEPHFSLKHMFKDVQLAIHMANALDIEVPATTVTAGVMYGALNHGWGELDYSSVFKLYDGAFTGAPAEAVSAEIPAPSAVPAQIEAPLESAGKDEESSVEAGEVAKAGPEPAAEAKAEPASIDFKSVEGLRAEPARVEKETDPAPQEAVPHDEANAMEVVADVPRNAKLTGDAGSDERKVGEGAAAGPPAEGVNDGGEPVDGQRAKPFNRIRRFFSSPAGK